MSEDGSIRVVPGTDQPARSVSDQSDAATVPGCRVLLIEDNPGDARLIAERLSQEGGGGFQLVSVDGLAAGIEHLRGAPTDVVLLDLSLPGSQGLETLQRARQAAPQVPIVVLTGLDDDTVALDALRSGAQDYLVKGQVDGRLLLRALRYAAERGRAEARLVASAEKFRLMFERSSHGLVLCDSAGRIRQVNQAFEALTGSPAQSLVDRSIESLLEQAGGAIGRARLGVHGATGGPDQGELIRSDGTRLPVVSTWVSIDEYDGVRRIWFTVADQTERKRAEQRLLQLSLYDDLTGLANRNLFQVTLVKALGRAERAASRLAVMLLDLDRFKSVNDTLGHDAGDALLAAVGQRLSEEMRIGDQLARLAGDEFAVILEDTKTPANAAVVAQKLVDTLAAPFQVSGQPVHVRASIGVGLYPDHARDAARLTKTADVAMYKAKEQGGGRFCFYSDSIDRELRRRVSFESELRQALRRDEFVLYYQPELELASGRVVCVEALLRWNHPRRGLVSAGRFIPYLESSGLIEAVGLWVLAEACRALRFWQQRLHRPDLRVAVNLSSRQLARPGLVKEVRDALAATSVAASSLELEATETLLLSNRHHAVRMLRALTGDGVHIAVDDFGTGYSSLQYLKLLPVQALKIDRSFIAGVPDSPSDVSIARGIIALARSLGFDIIGEGVESHTQLHFLIDEACQRAQGYLIGRPLVAEAVTRFITTHPERRPAE